jgi:hypothetical protein
MSDAALQSIIGRIRAAAAIGRSATTEIAREVNAELKESAAAGTTPDGTPWAPRKDGGRAMANAADAVAAAAVGEGEVLVVLRGAEVFHHFGVRGAEPRSVIPTGGNLPATLGEAVRRGAATVWKREVG